MAGLPHAAGSGGADLSRSVSEFELDRSKLFIGNVVSAGSNAIVYVGKYSNQLVAVKVMRIEKMATSRAYQDYIKECNILHKMSHPHVLRFVGVCCEPPNLCIVAEFLPGGSVYDLLHTSKRLPAGHTAGQLRLSAPLALRLASDVASGMAYLHSQGIIHRDLKSANLLLDAQDRVKVADFGVARRMSSTGEMTAETGTYRWMAPEVIRHAKYDELIDVYSFAIILWELLTSRLPYADMPSLAAAAGVVERNLRPPVPPDAPPAVADLLQRCWAAEPAVRPPFTRICEELTAIRATLDAAGAAPGGAA